MDITKRKSELNKDELRAYNSQKSRESYERRKQKIANQRALKRVMKATLSSKKCKEMINDDERGWTDKEKSMLNTACKKIDEILRVDEVPEEDVPIISENVSKLSKGFYQLYPKDQTSEAYMSTLNKSKNLSLSLIDCQNAFDYLFDNDLLMRNDRPKSEQQKKINLDYYKSKLNVVFKIYGTDNLLELYQNPENLHNKLVTSHLSMGAVKEYVSVLISLYKRSIIVDNSVFPDLTQIVHKDQLNKIREFMKKGIELSKANETFKFNTEAYYSWDDIKLILELIKMNIKKDNNLINFRDQLILQFYIKESVLRDNLGNVQIIYSRKDQYIPSDPTENLYFINEDVLIFKDFKTNNVFEPLTVYISTDTKMLINQYFSEYKKVFKKDPKYLITKNDGDIYKKGKLSKYIKTIFEKYTGSTDFSINDLRHSMATFHRYSSLEVKNYLAKMMQHSWNQHLKYERHSNVTLPFPNIKEEVFNALKIKKEPDFPLLNETCLYITNDNLQSEKMELSVGTIRKNNDISTKKYKIYKIEPNNKSKSSFPVSSKEKDFTYFIL